jgi:hypothetical protein
MSGTGVQSAMRRRTRPPPDPRKQMNSSTNTPRQTQEQPTPQQQQQQGQIQGQGQNPKMVNPTQILYMHQSKILAMENQLANLGAPVTGESTITNNNSIFELTSKVKEDIETNLDKRLSVINNNLNYVLNGVNEQRQKTKIIESMIQDLTNKNSLLEAALALKLDNDVFSDYKCLNDSIIDELRLNTENIIPINSDEFVSVSEQEIGKNGTIEPVEASTVEASTTEASTTEASTTEASTTEASTTEASTTEASTTEASTVEASTVEASTDEETTNTIADIKEIDNDTFASIENIKFDITEIAEPTTSEPENPTTTRNKKRR